MQAGELAAHTGDVLNRRAHRRRVHTHIHNHAAEPQQQTGLGIPQGSA